MNRPQLSLALILASLLAAAPAAEIPAAREGATGGPVAVSAEQGEADRRIEARIREIFAQIDSLSEVEVSVSAGVVRLRGRTMDSEAAQRAEELAGRVDGVVTIESRIQRDASVERRIAPALEETRALGEETVRFAPLVAVAVVVFLVLAFAGSRLARWQWLWRRITPNAFIAELLSTTVRIAFVGLGAIAALSLLDATAFLSAFLGAAGVLGLAVGFAVRDTIENYIASIMLSVRQPFQPNDHVVVDGREGHVVRLTSRATVLMTLDGNHLRIPNAMVFKAVILNYTRNPLRRFDFELGVDAEDDPLAAMETGLEAMKKLPFLLPDPAPLAFIRNVGDSNIVLFFAGWIDQGGTSFVKARSAAIATVKDALEEAGFALPEPIYRLRFDAAAARGALDEETPVTPPPRRPAGPAAAAPDVAPERDIERQVEAERREIREQDLLDEDAAHE